MLCVLDVMDEGGLTTGVRLCTIARARGEWGGMRVKVGWTCGALGGMWCFFWLSDGRDLCAVLGSSSMGWLG